MRQALYYSADMAGHLSGQLGHTVMRKKAPMSKDSSCPERQAVFKSLCTNFLGICITVVAYGTAVSCSVFSLH